MNVKDAKTRTKVLIVGAGILATAGLGIGAANAATPAPSTGQSVTGSQNGAIDTPTPGDTADAPGTVDTPTPEDTADAPGTGEATETPDAQEGPEAPGDTGPNVEQTGDHTDPGDAPGSP